MLLRVVGSIVPPCVEMVAGLIRRIILPMFGCITSPLVDGLLAMRLRSRHARGRSAHGSPYIPATDHRIRFGLHQSNRGGKLTLSYLENSLFAACVADDPRACYQLFHCIGKGLRPPADLARFGKLLGW